MLLQLTTAQCGKDWELLRRAFKIAGPPHILDNPFTEKALLESLLKNRMQAWYVVKTVGNQVSPCAVLLTTVVKDIHSDTSNLLVYSLYGISAIPEPEWALSIQTLVRFANAAMCKKLICYSNNERVIKFAELTGANTEQRLIMWDVPEPTEAVEIPFLTDVERNYMGEPINGTTDSH